MADGAGDGGMLGLSAVRMRALIGARQLSPVELMDADGNKFPVEKRMALCRCGASTEKPFCDGTHSKIGFQAAEKAVPESAER